MNLRKYIGEAFDALSDTLGQEVTYTRGSQWTKVCAVAGSSNLPVDEGNGVVVSYQSRDFIFRACDLTFGETPFTPKAGDTISEDIDGSTRTYVVSRPDDSNDQVWRFSDTGRMNVRVHTKVKK